MKAAKIQQLLRSQFFVSKVDSKDESDNSHICIDEDVGLIQ